MSPTTTPAVPCIPARTSHQLSTADDDAQRLDALVTKPGEKFGLGSKRDSRPRFRILVLPLMILLAATQACASSPTGPLGATWGRWRR